MTDTTLPPRFYLVKDISLGTPSGTGLTFTAAKRRLVCKVGYKMRCDRDNDIALRFAEGGTWWFHPSWLTPVARADEAMLADATMRAAIDGWQRVGEAASALALRVGDWVHIKCLYTDEQRRAARNGVTGPTWIEEMDTAMGQLGVITAVNSSGDYYVKHLHMYTARVSGGTFNPGWVTAVRDVALEVPRATAALLGRPLPDVVDAASAKRKRMADAVDALECDTRARIAALRASLAAL